VDLKESRLMISARNCGGCAGVWDWQYQYTLSLRI